MPPPEPCSRFCRPLSRPGPRSSTNIAYADQPQAATMPSETRVSIEEDKCRALRSAAAMERPRRPGRHRHGQRDQQPLPAGEPGPREDRQHQGQVGERHEEHQGQRQPPAQPPHRGLFGRSPGVRPGRAGHLRGVAGRLDHADQVWRGHGRRGGYVGPFGGKVDGRGDAVELVQPGLDPGGASGAGHPADDQLDLARSVVSGAVATMPVTVSAVTGLVMGCPGR